MKFQIGERVTTNRTGPPASGVVVGTIIGKFWANHLMRRPVSSYGYYNELYPGWHQRLLYLVHYDTPQRNITKEEFVNHGQEEEMYEILCPFQECVYVPEDDLTSLDNETF